MEITRQMSIADLVAHHPWAVPILKEKGLNCIFTGEPVWGSLEALALAKGYDDYGLELLVEELNQLKDDHEE